MRQKLVILAGLVLLLALGACARQGYPSGGPRDSEPPKVMGSKPLNETRNFKATQFFIEFNEFVVLKNATENVLVSPPMAQKPDYSVKGKGVLVQLHDSLRPNTTYLFQFKEAIADFTEGNLLPSYEYVFSTGADMDTLMLAGQVRDARSGKPWSEVLTVTAYRDADTAPSFVTRTDKQGNFAFHYIPSGSYRIVALSDKNRNLLVDSTETVAWDTLRYTPADSIDSTALARLAVSTPDRRRQRVLHADFTERGRITIATLLPMQQPQLTGEPLEWRLNTKGDTLSVWCLNAQCDSTVLVLTDGDQLGDTLRLRHRTVRKGRGKTEIPQKESLMKALCSGRSAYYDDLRLAFAVPVTAAADRLEAEVMLLKDSSVSHCPILLDSGGLTARLATSLHSDEEYRVRVADSLFTDLYGHPSDSLVFTLTPKDYGSLVLHIDNPTGYPLVIEVLDSKDTVVQHSTLNAQLSTLRFSHLPAADYRLRAVVDRNGDGQWTTGDWFARRHPEECIMFEKTLQLREKWELEEKWTVSDKKQPDENQAQ